LFVVLSAGFGFVSLSTSQQMRWEERHRNDLLCVEWNDTSELVQDSPSDQQTDRQTHRPCNVKTCMGISRIYECWQCWLCGL